MNTSTQSSCKNCNSELEGPYCSQCGQREINFREDWKGLITEFLSSFFNFDGKVLVGVVQLMFRPGVLTQAFLEGKRTSQIPPLRLYLFVSLILLLWIGINDDGTTSIQFSEPSIASTDQESINEDEIDNWIVRKSQNPEVVKQEFFKILPKALIVGIFLLALMTRILFLKSDYVYIEHLVISLHFQSFAFLWILFSDGWIQLISLASPTLGDFTGILMSIWMLTYPFFYLKKLFKLSIKKALLSTLLLECVYLFILVFGVAGLAILSLLLA